MTNTATANYFAHETAVIDEPVSIGDGTRIWCFTHVLAGAAIGRNCVLGQGVSVASKVRIGDGCRIQDHVSLYDGVILEDHVFCGPSCVFTNVLNPRCEFPRRNEYRPTLVKRGASIGANATIRCGVTLGSYCFVGAGAVVTRDVPAFALVVGVPARQAGWMSRFGEPLVFDAGGRAACEQTGDEYELRNDGVVVMTKKSVRVTSEREEGLLAHSHTRHSLTFRVSTFS